MIIYKTDRWLSTVFTYKGTAWPNIKGPFIFWVIFVTSVFFTAATFEIQISREGHTVLGGTISFLLIFRANNAYARYWIGRGCVNTFFDDLRNAVMICLSHLQPSSKIVSSMQAQDKAYDMDPAVLVDNAVNIKINVVRLTVAFAVALKTYTRIGLDGYVFGSISKETKWFLDWDRFRLKQLLYPTEFRFVDDCLGLEYQDGEPKANTLQELAEQFKKYEEPPEWWPETFKVNTRPAARLHIPIVFFLREQWLNSMNDFQNTMPWGIKERFVPQLSQIMHSAQHDFEMVSQIMTTPLPLPYACLCKTLLTIWMASYPFVVDFTLGYFGGAVVPILVVFALLGIDAIATELENPFGDDANDLDFIELIHNLESEVLEMLTLIGDSKARAGLIWRRLPGFIAETSCKPVRKQLVVAALAAEEVIKDPKK